MFTNKGEKYMPFDSEGMFSRLHNWEDDRINDIDIVCDRLDEEEDNFAEGLSQCFLKNGNSQMEGNFNAGNFKLMNVADGALPSDAVNRSQLDNITSENSSLLKEVMNTLFKVGDIKASTIAENHDNWLLCDGQAVSRSDYADLFALIGDSFGEGNGVTTFNVPDYRGKFLRGLGGDSEDDIYTTQEESLPDIEAKLTSLGDGSNGTFYTADGAFGDLASPTSYTHGGGSSARAATMYNSVTFKASRDSEIYGASEHVTPINQAVNFFIKAKKEE